MGDKGIGNTPPNGYAGKIPNNKNKDDTTMSTAKLFRLKRTSFSATVGRRW